MDLIDENHGIAPWGYLPVFTALNGIFKIYGIVPEYWNYAVFPE